MMEVLLITILVALMVVTATRAASARRAPARVPVTIDRRRNVRRR
jgi:hypothetical protein